MKNKKLTLKTQNKILDDIDDEIYLLKKRIELKYSLSLANVRDAVNYSIKRLYGIN